MDKLVKWRYFSANIEIITKFDGAYDLSQSILKIDGIFKTIDGIKVFDFENGIDHVVWEVEIDQAKHSANSLAHTIQAIFDAEFGFALHMVINIVGETVLTFDKSHAHIFNSEIRELN